MTIDLLKDTNDKFMNTLKFISAVLIAGIILFILSILIVCDQGFGILAAFIILIISEALK